MQTNLDQLRQSIKAPVRYDEMDCWFKDSSGQFLFHNTIYSYFACVLKLDMTTGVDRAFGQFLADQINLWLSGEEMIPKIKVREFLSTIRIVSAHCDSNGLAGTERMIIDSKMFDYNANQLLGE